MHFFVFLYKEILLIPETKVHFYIRFVFFSFLSLVLCKCFLLFIFFSTANQLDTSKFSIESDLIFHARKIFQQVYNSNEDYLICYYTRDTFTISREQNTRSKWCAKRNLFFYSFSNYYWFWFGYLLINYSQFIRCGFDLKLIQLALAYNIFIYRRNDWIVILWPARVNEIKCSSCVSIDD